jgi:hypothetical protein
MGHERLDHVRWSIPEHAAAPCAEEKSTMTVCFGDREHIGGPANERSHELRLAASVAAVVLTSVRSWSRDHGRAERTLEKFARSGAKPGDAWGVDDVVGVEERTRPAVGVVVLGLSLEASVEPARPGKVLLLCAGSVEETTAYVARRCEVQEHEVRGALLLN